MRGYGVFYANEIQAWFILEGDAMRFVASCNYHLEVRPTEIGILREVEDEVKKELAVVKGEVTATSEVDTTIHTRNEWLSLNPLYKFMRSNNISYTVMSGSYLASKIKPYRLQRLALGLEEPTMDEYIVMGQAMKTTNWEVPIRKMWEEWFEVMPYDAFENASIYR